MGYETQILTCPQKLLKFNFQVFILVINLMCWFSYQRRHDQIILKIFWRHSSSSNRCVRFRVTIKNFFVHSEFVLVVKTGSDFKDICVEKLLKGLFWCVLNAAGIRMTKSMICISFRRLRNTFKFKFLEYRIELDRDCRYKKVKNISNKY